MPINIDGTPPINLPVDQIALWQGRQLSYRGRAQDRMHKHVFVDSESVPASMTDRELLNEQQSGRLRLVSPDELAREEGARPSRVFDLASPSDLKEVEYRLRYVRAWVRAERPSRTDSVLGPLLRAVATEHGENSPPSPRTFNRWLSDWLLVGEKPEGLLPSKGGNRTDRIVGARDILRTTVEEYYLVNTRPTATTVLRFVANAIDEHNKVLADDEKLPMVTLKTLMAEIRRVDQYTLDFSRLGPRVAAHRHRPVTSGPVTERHNQVWETDHTLIDAVVLEEQTRFPIGRAWVTVTLDRATRAATGLRFGFDPPAAYSALDCLRVAIAPKDELLALIPGLKGTWPCFGVPETLITDQGKEFKSKSFLEACLALGIDVQYTPVLKAWYKGRIERFFRTLSRDVFHRVPGSTYSNIFQRNGEVIPETVAVTTLSELRAMTIQYLVEIYNRRPHRALGGRAPIDLWNESVARHGVRMPPAKDELAELTSLISYRRPQRYGIQFENLKYNSGDVARFRVRYETPPLVRIRVNPRDLSYIWFIDPVGGQSHKVPIIPAMRPLVDGISLEKHLLARALQRQNPERLAGEAGLRRAYRILDEAMLARANQSGTRNRVRAARYWESLTRETPPEEPPAFDTGRSANSIVDDIMNSDAEEVAEPQNDADRIPPNPADDHPEPENGPAEGPVRGRVRKIQPEDRPRPDRPKRRARRAEDATPEAEAEELAELEALAASLGRKMINGTEDK